MIKFCPILGRSDGRPLIDCNDRCVMYNPEDNGCIIRKAIEIYIKNHIPITMKQPTEEELNKLTEELKEILAKHPMEPIFYKHPDLNIQHDYDEYGEDWYPPGPNDIAP